MDGTTEYVDRAKFKPLWVKQESLGALEKHEKALEVALNDSNHTKLEIAKYYERAKALEICMTPGREKILKGRIYYNNNTLLASL